MDNDVGMTAEQLSEKYGTDHSWGEHPVHARSEWKREVENDDTICGYWAWVVSRIELAHA